MGNQFVKKQFISYEEFINFCQRHQIKSWNHYRFLIKPKDLPSNPNLTYAKQWRGWQVITGSGGPTRWASFKEAREYMRSLKLNGRRGWLEWAKSPQRPRNIPSNPYIIYRDEWVSWYDFLGTEWIKYPPAKLFAIRSEVFKAKDWTKKGLNEIGTQKPRNIPFVISRIYKKEWEGMRAFLGVKPLSFPKFIEFLLNNKIRKQKELNEYLTQHPQKGIIRTVKLHYPHQWPGWVRFRRKYKSL